MVLLKQLVPGSLEFFVAALIVALLPVLFRRRLWRWSAALVILLAAGYLAFSLPWVATHLARPLYRYEPLTRVEDARGATTVVVLDGDHDKLRILETARLYALLQPERVFVATPRLAFLQAVIDAGVPENRVVWEHWSLNTRGQVWNVRAMLQGFGIRRVVIVASPLHMPRVLGICAAAGLEAIPSASARPYTTLFRRAGPWSPRYEALILSYESIYEYAAQWWYARRGWTRSVSP